MLESRQGVWILPQTSVKLCFLTESTEYIPFESKTVVTLTVT